MCRYDADELCYLSIDTNGSSAVSNTSNPTSEASDHESAAPSKRDAQQQLNGNETNTNTTATSNESKSRTEPVHESERKTNSSDANPDIKMPMSNNNLSEGTSNPENGTVSGRRLLEDNASKGSLENTSEHKDKNEESVHSATVENDGALEDEMDSSFDILRESDEMADEYNYDYDDYVDESLWGDEEWTEQEHEKPEDYVNIDAHILSTPVCWSIIQ